MLVTPQPAKATRPRRQGRSRPGSTWNVSSRRTEHPYVEPTKARLRRRDADQRRERPDGCPTAARHHSRHADVGVGPLPRLRRAINLVPSAPRRTAPLVRCTRRSRFAGPRSSTCGAAGRSAATARLTPRAGRQAPAPCGTAVRWLAALRPVLTMWTRAAVGVDVIARVSSEARSCHCKRQESQVNADVVACLQRDAVARGEAADASVTTRKTSAKQRRSTVARFHVERFSHKASGSYGQCPKAVQTGARRQVGRGNRVHGVLRSMWSSAFGATTRFDLDR